MSTICYMEKKKRNRKKKIPLPVILAELERCRGGVYLAAKNLKISHVTMFHYLRDYPEAQAIVDAARGQVLDVAELNLIAAVQKGQPWAITFMLKTIGRNRGYNEKLELENTKPVEVVTMSLSEWTERQNKAALQVKEALTIFDEID